MSNGFQVIDERTWPRAMHCAVFRNCVEPAFCVTFEVDVTSFYERVKARGLSFTLAMVHAVCACANEVDALAQASGCADLALGFVPEDVRERAQALKANERSVEAVKVVREATGMSLVEAKKFVDAL